MTETKPASADNIVELKAKPAAQRAATSVTEFVREHPLLVAAGGIAVGLLAGSLLPRGAGRRIASRAVTLAELGAAAGVAFGKDALDKAEHAGSVGRDFGKQAWGRAETTASTVGKRGEAAAGELVEAGERLVRKAAEFASRMRH